MKLIKTTSSTRIRNFCIDHNFYTAGDNKAYNHLLNVIVDETNLTDRRIEKIAEDIMVHSNPETLVNLDIFNVADMMNLLIAEAIHIYYFYYE